MFRSSKCTGEEDEMYLTNENITSMVGGSTNTFL